MRALLDGLASVWKSPRLLERFLELLRELFRVGWLVGFKDDGLCRQLSLGERSEMVFVGERAQAAAELPVHRLGPGTTPSDHIVERAFVEPWPFAAKQLHHVG
jgi:hypothetical protein